MPKDINLELQHLTGICSSTLSLVQNLRDDAEMIATNAAGRAIRQHERDCTAKKDITDLTRETAKNTGTIRVLSSIKNAGKSLPGKWKLIVSVIVAALGTIGTIGACVF